MDEESQKRNTDCVYFLASPLTCKKGIHCEFRHSEAARFHPRDCRFWLAGNCLNANCSFRHPPLDGRPASVSASAPAPSKAASTPSIAATSLSMPANKSRVPCYYFSQGFCCKGDRCAFLHGPWLSMSAQAVDAQKPPKAPTCKGVETNDKATSVVETNGPTVKTHGSQAVKPGALMTAVHSLPSNVFIRAQETSCLKDEAARARNSEISTHASSIKKQNSPDLHDGRQSVKKQRQIRDEPQLELIRCAEARQQQHFADEERTQNGTWRNGLVKEASPGFVDESDTHDFGLIDNSVYGEDLPYPIANILFPKRSFSCNDTHDFGLIDQDHPRFHNTSLTSEQDSYKCFDLLYDYDSQHSYPSSKGRHQSPFYARRDRHRIKGDLRDRLGKRRNYFQDQVSDINGYSDCFQDMDDHANVDERGWDDSFDWAASRRDREIYWRGVRGTDRGSVHTPNYCFRLDIGEDNADQVSSGSSPMRFSVNDFQRSNYFNIEGSSYSSRRARRYSKLEVSGLGAQHRLAQARLESEINADHCLQTQGADTLRSEIHSSSFSGFVKRPSIKSRVLPASSSEEVDLRGCTSNDFEGPKPLSILLQQNRKVKADSGETSAEQAGFDREERANDVRNYSEQAGFDREECANDVRKFSNRFCSEKGYIASRKRKQEDSFDSC